MTFSGLNVRVQMKVPQPTAPSSLSSHSTPTPVRSHSVKGLTAQPACLRPSNPWKCVPSCLGRESQSPESTDTEVSHEHVFLATQTCLSRKEGCDYQKGRVKPPKWESRGWHQTPDLRVVRLVFKLTFA